MKRKTFLKSLGLLSLAGATGGIAYAMKLNALNKITGSFDNTDVMPVLFIGHGSPMNAIEDNQFSEGMKSIANNVPVPTAILMVSAHWETRGTYVTAQDFPPTIHDFGGFPQELFDVQYPAPGSKWLDDETINAVTKTSVGKDTKWGFDHGCWSVTKNMYPDANIPIIQLSLDYSQPAQYHYDLAQELASLRRKGVLIIGSGNMVHNLGMISVPNGDFNAPYAYDWAKEANDKFKELILNGDHQSLINYQALGRSAQLSIPTPEHYLPMLYAVALQEKKENVTFFNDVTVGGSASMTSLVIKS